MEITPLQMALVYEGVAERPGRDTHPLIEWWLSLCDGIGEGADDETAWCSAFVNGMCHPLGIERSRKANARSWLKIGEVVELEDAKPGWDIVVFWRGEVDSWQGHVGFYFGRAPNGDIIVWGGNQNNRVCAMPYGTHRFLGARRLRDPSLTHAPPR